MPMWHFRAKMALLFWPYLLSLCIQELLSWPPISNGAEKLKLEIAIYLLRDLVSLYEFYIVLTKILLRTQKCIIHGCMLSVQWSMTIFVLNFGGQLVRRPHSRRRSGFESGLHQVNVCAIRTQLCMLCKFLVVSTKLFLRLSFLDKSKSLFFHEIKFEKKPSKGHKGLIINILKHMQV